MKSVSDSPTKISAPVDSEEHNATLQFRVIGMQYASEFPMSTSSAEYGGVYAQDSE